MGPTEANKKKKKSANCYTENTCEETSRVESKVVYAISRLQNFKTKTGKRRKLTGVTNQKIVEFLSKNYCYMDGDIESQVITALLSCIKNGVVCILNDGRYRLVGPDSKSMISKCLTRTSHGPKCVCLNMINLVSKICPTTCCSVATRKNTPQWDINKVMKKSQKKNRYKKRARNRQSGRKQTRARSKIVENFGSDTLGSKKSNLDAKTASPRKRRTNCNQELPVIRSGRLWSNISSRIFRKFVTSSDKVSALEEVKS